MPSNLLNNKTTQQEQQRNKNNNKIIRMKKNGSNKHNNKQKTTTNDKNKNKNKKQPTTTKHIIPTNIKVKQFLQIQQQFQQKYRFKQKKKPNDQLICSARGSTLFGAFTSAWKPKALPSMPGFKDPLTLNVSSWCGGNIGKIWGFMLTAMYLGYRKWEAWIMVYSRICKLGILILCRGCAQGP